MTLADSRGPEASPSPLRIALATPPFPQSIEHGLRHVSDLAQRAAASGAAIVCFPECYIPGMRGIDEPVAPHDPAALEQALHEACAVARRSGIALILPMDRDHASGIQIVAWVISAQGEPLGHQAKTQLDPTEDATFVPGTGRQLFEVAGVRFGISICHEGFRYPETVRWAARAGASLVFHPHCTGSNHVGQRPTGWRAAGGRYYEHAMVCRALENEIYFASVNYAFRFQESATCVVSPGGECLGFQPYGEAGVLVVDIDTAAATRRLAHRFEPDRYGAASGD